MEAIINIALFVRSAVGYPYPSCAEANSFVYGSPSSDIYQNSSDCQSNPSCYSGQLRNASEHLYNAYNRFVAFFKKNFVVHME